MKVFFSKKDLKLIENGKLSFTELNLIFQTSIVYAFAKYRKEKNKKVGNNK